MQFREDVTVEATGDLVAVDGSLSVRRRLAYMVCHGGVCGLQFIIYICCRGS
jgi:hypothetical protein